MFGLLSYLTGDEFVGSAAAVTCVVAGCLVWRRLWKHRELRREYRKRERQRRQFWGWG